MEFSKIFNTILLLGIIGLGFYFIYNKITYEFKKFYTILFSKNEDFENNELSNHSPIMKEKNFKDFSIYTELSNQKNQDQPEENLITESNISENDSIPELVD